MEQLTNVLEVNAPDFGKDETVFLLEDAGLPEDNVLISYKKGARVYANHNRGGDAYHLIRSLNGLNVDFSDRYDDETGIDHVLLAPTKDQALSSDVIIKWLSPGDIVYLREGTEVENLDDDGFTMVRNDRREDVRWLVDDEDLKDIEFKFIKKKFFKEENIDKFVKKFIDDDGNAQESSGNRGLTILNVKKKDIWEEIAESEQPPKCEGAQIVFKGTPRDDVLIGNNCNNVLMGGKGDDILDGRGGDDFLIGGKGRDTFVYSEGYDVIVNFDEEKDRLDLGSLQYGIDYVVEEFVNPVGGTGVNFIFAE